MSNDLKNQLYVFVLIMLRYYGSFWGQKDGKGNRPPIFKKCDYQTNIIIDNTQLTTSSIFIQNRLLSYGSYSTNQVGYFLLNTDIFLNKMFKSLQSILYTSDRYRNFRKWNCRSDCQSDS